MGVLDVRCDMKTAPRQSQFIADKQINKAVASTVGIRTVAAAGCEKGMGWAPAHFQHRLYRTITCTCMYTIGVTSLVALFSRIQGKLWP